MEELKIEDVMCGDWVDVRNDAAPDIPHIEKITPSHLLRDEHWYGIELVPDILEKIGWKRWSDTTGCFEDDNHNRLEITIDDDGIWWSYNDAEYYILELKYVHELQHAIKMNGIKKEIVL